jgi:hypothetical protein
MWITVEGDKKMKKKYIIAIMCAFALIISANSYLSYDGTNEIKDICFDFVYPISFIMPDGSPIIVDSEDYWDEIKEWYEVNPDVKEKPVLQFPVDVIFKDGTVKTINNEDELKKAYEYCSGTDKTKYDDICFKFVYPITYTMPDGSIIIIENKDDWNEIKEWYEVNPDVKEKPVLQFPVDIIFKDGTVKNINNEEELKEAYESCWDWDKDDDKEDEDDDDDNGEKSNKRRRLRNLLIDRLRTYLDRLRVRLRERQT